MHKLLSDNGSNPTALSCEFKSDGVTNQLVIDMEAGPFVCDFRKSSYPDALRNIQVQYSDSDGTAHVVPTTGTMSNGVVTLNFTEFVPPQDADVYAYCNFEYPIPQVTS